MKMKKYSILSKVAKAFKKLKNYPRSQWVFDCIKKQVNVCLLVVNYSFKLHTKYCGSVHCCLETAG